MLFSELYKIMVNIVTCVGFRRAIAPALTILRFVFLSHLKQDACKKYKQDVCNWLVSSNCGGSFVGDLFLRIYAFFFL